MAENADPNVSAPQQDDDGGFDEIFAGYREQRLAQLKKEYGFIKRVSHLRNFLNFFCVARAQQRDAMKVNGHGEYSELKTEKEFLQITTKTKVSFATRKEFSMTFFILIVIFLPIARYCPLLPQRFY